MNSRKAELRLAAQFEDAIARGACLAPAMQRDYQLLKRRMNQKKVVEPRPGVFAPADCWNKLGDRQRYLHVLRSMAVKHPDWVFCSFSAAVIQGLAVSKKQLRAIHIASPANHCGEAQLAWSAIVRLSSRSSPSMDLKLPQRSRRSFAAPHAEVSRKD